MTPEQIEIEGMALVAPQLTGLCYICEDTAFHRNQYGPLCPWHFSTWRDHQNSNTPLLAQCAALLTRCADLTASLLGGPIATHGLIDEIRSVQKEIRRVRAELAKGGW